MQDLDRAWARFRDTFEAERARIAGLIETACAALESRDAPLGAVREVLTVAEDELVRLDRAVADMHALMLAVYTVNAATSSLLN